MMISLVAALAPNLLLWLCLMLLLTVSRSRIGRTGARPVLGAAAVALLWLLSTRPVAETVLAPLESRYQQVSPADLARRDVRQVVVLTAGGFSDRHPLISSTLPPSSAYRFLAGIELCSGIGPDCRLLFSGSAGRSQRDVTAADSMRKLAERLPLEFESVAESASGSTAEHPVNVARLLHEGPFALVTSAFHMPRAMRSFARYDLQPIPCPADPLVRGDYRWIDWLPSAGSLGVTTLAAREYLALLLYTLRGW